MSCTNCNKSNCTCSDNCPNKTSDITVFDCNNFNVIEVPCDSSLCDVLALLESYTTNMVNELADMTSVIITEPNCIELAAGTYSIQQVIDAILVQLCDEMNTFTATCIINSSRDPASGVIPYLDPVLTLGMQSSQVIYKYNSVTSNNVVVTSPGFISGSWVENTSLPTISFGTFDNDSTGAFTIGEDGTYSITGSIQLKSNNESSVTWQTTENPGAVGLAILAGVGDVYGGNYETVIPGIQRDISITSSIGAYLTAGSIVRLGVLNLSNRNYNGNAYTASDIIRFSITKIR